MQDQHSPEHSSARPSPLPELARFDSKLAQVMFIEPDVPGAYRPTRAQMRLAQAVARAVQQANEARLHSMLHALNTRILPCLGTQAMIEVAQAIEQRAPWLFDNLPILQAHRRRLSRAAEMASAFSPTHLEKLGQALRKEASRS
jgi:hypothetical protein